jgi:NAD(P)-dependent dehydrogenase (short-subunit alcohol dehydrogenase family)
MSHSDGLGRVLVTGGASGLGSAVADAVAAEGGQPIVMDLVAPRRAHVHFAVDLADTAMTESVVGFIAADGLDAVVTCAAIDSCGPLETVKTEDWERVVQVNLMGTAAVIRASMGALLESQGQVVTVASTLGRRALPDASAYCASKFGVVGLTRALNAEMGHRLRITCVMPGGMDTPFFDGRPQKYRPAVGAPLMDPADVAQVIVDVLRRHGSANVPEIMITPGGETSWP